MSLTKELEIFIDNDDKYNIVGSLFTNDKWYRVIYEEDNTTILLAVYCRENAYDMSEFYVFRGLNSLCDLVSFIRKNKIRFEEIRGKKEFLASIINELLEEVE